MRVVYLSRHFNRSGYEVLKALIGSDVCDLRAVVLPPVRPAQGRMRRLDHAWSAWFERAAYRVRCAWQGAAPLRFECSIRRLAGKAGIQVEIVPSLKSVDGRRRLAAHGPDLLVLGGGWPELLPREVLELAPLGVVNTHPSLLPDYRGTDVHRWQILDGIRTSGTSIHYVDDRFDTGTILGQERVEIPESATPQFLFQRTAEVSGPLMMEVLRKISAAAPARVQGPVQPDVDQPSLPKWPWADERLLALDPTCSAAEVERCIRASTQESYVYDGPWIRVRSRQFIVRRAAVVAGASSITGAKVGSLRVQQGRPLLRCQDSDLELCVLQERRPVPMSTRSMTGPRFTRRFLSEKEVVDVLG